MVIVESVQPLYSALLFDFDGTLVDSLPAHLKAWQVTMRALGVKLSLETFQQFSGISPWEICASLVAMYDLDVDIEDVTERKARCYLEFLDMVSVHKPVLEIVRENYGKIPLAVATGNYAWLADETLRAKNIRHYFDVVVSSREVPHNKPAPDVFLEAARRIGQPPGMCCAFEDTDRGEEAARSAGMDVVRIQDLLA